MAKPLLDISCIEESSCKYPVAVRIAMDDGTIQTYNLECQPHPNFVSAMDALGRMFDCIEISGYQYRPRRKNRIHRSEL